MANQNIVEIVLRAVDQGLQKGLKDAGVQLDSLDKKGKTAAGGAQALGLGARAAAAGINLTTAAAAGLTAGAGIALGKFLKDSVEEFSKAELADRRFVTALEQTGRATPEAADAFRELAGELQQLTKAGDDTILEMGALLLNLGVMPGKLEGATRAGLDLAAGLGIDVRSAMMLVGRAASGNIEMFSRYGVNIDEAAFKARGFDAVLDQLNGKFGGQAAKNAGTLSAKYQGMKNALGDLGEQTGRFAAGPLALLSEGIDKSAQFWTFFLKKAGDWIGIAPIEAEVTQKSADSKRQLAEALQQAERAFGPMEAAASKFFETISKGLLPIEEELLKKTDEVGLMIMQLGERTEAGKKLAEVSKEMAVLSIQMEGIKKGGRLYQEFAKELEALRKEQEKWTKAVTASEPALRKQAERLAEERRQARMTAEEKKKAAEEQERLDQAIIKQHAETAEIIVRLDEEQAEEEARIASERLEKRLKAEEELQQAVIKQQVETAEILIRLQENEAEEEAKIAEKRAEQTGGALKKIEAGFGSAAERGMSDFLFHLGDGTEKGVNVLKEFGRAAKRVVADAIASFAKETFINPAISAVSGAARNLLGFAEGALVQKPTVALIGEAGPELVIPLDVAGTFLKGAIVDAARTSAASEVALSAGIAEGSQAAQASAATAAGAATTAALFVMFDAIQTAFGGNSAIRAIGDIAFGGRGKQGLIEKGLGELGIPAFRKKGGEFNLPMIQSLYAEALAAPPVPPFSFNELMARLGSDDPGRARALLAPYLGEGGFITGPTLALVGERGREAVLPLDSPSSMRGLTESLRPIVRGLFEEMGLRGGPGAGGRVPVVIQLVLNGRAIQEISREVDVTNERRPRTLRAPRPGWAGV